MPTDFYARIEERIGRLKELRRGTYSHASRAYYSGAIDELMRLQGEIREDLKRA